MIKFVATTVALLVALAGPVAAQETTNVAGVRAAIEDLRDGTLDDVAATQNVINTFRNAKQKTRKNWRIFGPLEDIIFWETFDGYDLYLVSFQSARVVIRTRNNSKGEIRSIRYRSVAVEK